MRNYVKVLSFVLILTTVFVSCSKDDDDAPKTVKLTSVSYSPNKIEGEEKTAFSGKDIQVNPEEAEATFKFNNIKKDGETITTGEFKMNSNGKISGLKDHKIGVGTYVLTVAATDKNDKDNVKTTTYTVVIKE